MKRIVPVIVLIVAAAVGYAVWTGTRTPSGGASGLGGSGTIEATDVTVSSLVQTPSRVVSAAVEPGQRVEKGQVLFQLDRTLADYQVQQAQAGVRAAEATLEQDEDDDASDAQIAQDRATLDQARIAVKLAEAQASYTTVSSPIDGIALDVPAGVGENASPGQTLAVIGDVSRLTVAIFVPEPRIGEVKVGQKGTLTTDSTGAETFPCVVTSIASQAEFTPSSIETRDQRVKLVYAVTLDVTDASGRLKPGMPADVTLR